MGHLRDLIEGPKGPKRPKRPKGPKRQKDICHVPIISTLQIFGLRFAREANLSVMNFEGRGYFPLPEKFI